MSGADDYRLCSSMSGRVVNGFLLCALRYRQGLSNAAWVLCFIDSLGEAATKWFLNPGAFEFPEPSKAESTHRSYAILISHAETSEHVAESGGNKILIKANSREVAWEWTLFLSHQHLQASLFTWRAGGQWLWTNGRRKGFVPTDCFYF